MYTKGGCLDRWFDLNLFQNTSLGRTHATNYRNLCKVENRILKLMSTYLPLVPLAMARARTRKSTPLRIWKQYSLRQQQDPSILDSQKHNPCPSLFYTYERNVCLEMNEFTTFKVATRVTSPLLQRFPSSLYWFEPSS